MIILTLQGKKHDLYYNDLPGGNAWSRSKSDATRFRSMGHLLNSLFRHEGNRAGLTPEPEKLRVLEVSENSRVEIEIC